jgi:hypothetical protein
MITQQNAIIANKIFFPGIAMKKIQKRILHLPSNDEKGRYNSIKNFRRIFLNQFNKV